MNRLKITKLDDTLDKLVTEAGPERTPGLHLSQIIRSIMETLEPSKYAAGAPINTLFTDPGFTFERMLEIAWGTRLKGLFRPGEFEEDGITCSPDYIDIQGNIIWLVELKMTSMSMVGCPTDPKFRKWLWQIAAYCYVLKTRYSRLHVLWLRGDYRSVQRAYEVYEIVWEQEELDAIWALLVKHAREKGWLS